MGGTSAGIPQIHRCARGHCTGACNAKALLRELALRKDSQVRLPIAAGAAPPPAKPKPLTKEGIARALASDFELDVKLVRRIITSLADLGKKEVATTGVFILHRLAKVKRIEVPAKTGGIKKIFGKMVYCKDRPATMSVKAYSSKSLKPENWRHRDGIHR